MGRLHVFGEPDAERDVVTHHTVVRPDGDQIR
jgi:hypothetical protein